MTIPRPPQELSPRQRDSLLRKYRALLQKHACLVQRVEQRNEQRLWMYQLGQWLLRSHSSGVALVGGGSIRATNPRWDQLGRPRGGWRRAEGSTAVYRDLRQVARDEALELIAEGASSRVRRYTHAEGDGVIELRIEKVGAGGDEVLLLAHELTEAIKTEQELTRAREQLARRERLRSVGELAAGIAHDLNSTLLAARCWLDQIETAPPKRRSEVVGRLRATLDDAGTRIAKVRDFVRRGPAREPSPVLLGPLLADAAQLARSAREAPPYRVQLAPALDQLPPVLGVEGELRFVFANVLLNALDAGGAVQVKAEAAEEVVISVEDSGEGFSAEALREARKPLFTTKIAYGGMGLGLAVAHDVMRQIGGSIELENRVEGGARVRLTFRRAVSLHPPRAGLPGAVPRSGSAAPAATPPAGSRRRRALRSARSS